MRKPDSVSSGALEQFGVPGRQGSWVRHLKVGPVHDVPPGIN